MQMTAVPPHFPQGIDTCLIVEDSEFDQLKMGRVVRKSCNSMRIEVANTLKSARRMLERGEPALILLDNNLPDGLGADFALELAKDPKLAGVPVIMVSDWPSPIMWEKAASAGVAYVVNKTEFDPKYVHAVLQKGKSRQMN
ncbi:putative response regulator recevier domain protein [Sulfitobacter noctilucae]|uniref:response regulator n=1 Tax=Sulfitobacter noctilucae TaxID=1342302 RepID=UPI000467F325|nr:response regulator [Sulfitobacter noctilucae]KIN75306.1 putative response regulator recevier domain protein [Sulfitobacter noctilucae]